MYPVSVLAVFLLNSLGIAADLDTSTITASFCDLILGGVVYRIIHECTGVFALLIFLALVFAYPASLFHKMQGVFLGLPAFYIYSALRLVILGAAAHFHSDWVELFHLYMMVLVNLGFLLFVWMYWIDWIDRRD
jgi:exosortase/archaeosortase family protein